MADARAHVTLLVDFANLRQQLTPEDGSADATPAGRDIARALVKYAGGVGRVGVARAYADWTREPELARQLNGTRLAPVLVPATEDGEDRSHIRLAIDAMEALYGGDEPDAYVLVTSDLSLVPLVQALRGDGSEVVVVASSATPVDELKAEADRFEAFEDVLAGKEATAVTLRPSRDRAPGGRSSDGGAGQAGGRREERAAAQHDRPLLTEPNFENYDWTSFVQLIDELEQRLPFVGVRYLVNKVLGPHNCAIDDPRIKRDLMNEAVDEGLIEMYTVGNVNDRTDPVTACRLDRENEIVIEVLKAAAEAEAAEAEDAVEADDLSPVVN
ncbi:MAG: NYN domain-containing protein [Planctomycetota bacterium]|nr:NYN domain-containing protein [Planctomycetota bacterium]